MLHERLTEDQTEWGLTPQQYQRRESARLRERDRKRAAIALARPREANGQFAKAKQPAIGEVFMTAHGPAYRVECEMQYGLGSVQRTITLPFVSIQGKAA